MAQHQAEDKQSQQESDIDSESYDSLQQQVAFEIKDQPEENMDEDQFNENQQRAIEYILFVRNQQKQLRKEKQVMRCEVYHSQANNNQRGQEAINEHIKQGKDYSWMNEWAEASIQNWKCVIANIVYFNKRQTQQSSKLIINEQLFARRPKMTDFDAPLLLPHIEDVLVELSTQYLNMFRQKDAKLYFLKPRDYAVNFHIWLSTLLAFHQSVSFYTNFQALGFINAAMSRSYDYLSQQLTNQDNRPQFKDITLAMMINIVLLTRVFQQKPLEKYFDICEVIF